MKSAPRVRDCCPEVFDGRENLRSGHCGRPGEVLERPAYVGGIVGEQMRKVVGRDCSPAEYVHGVMCAHDDAVVAVFRGAGDHLLIAIGHEHGEQ